MANTQERTRTEATCFGRLLGTELSVLLVASYSSYDKHHNMKSRLDILSDIYGEKEAESGGSSLRDGERTSRKACTVCIQQRLRFRNGKILNEKLITVVNKQLCYDMNNIKKIIEKIFNGLQNQIYNYLNIWMKTLGIRNEQKHKSRNHFI